MYKFVFVNWWLSNLGFSVFFFFSPPHAAILDFMISLRYIFFLFASASIFFFSHFFAILNRVKAFFFSVLFDYLLSNRTETFGGTWLLAWQHVKREESEACTQVWFYRHRPLQPKAGHRQCWEWSGYAAILLITILAFVSYLLLLLLLPRLLLLLPSSLHKQK